MHVTPIILYICCFTKQTHLSLHSPDLLVTCIYPTFSSFQMKLQNNISYQMADIHRLKGEGFMAKLIWQAEAVRFNCPVLQNAV